MSTSANNLTLQTWIKARAMQDDPGQQKRQAEAFDHFVAWARFYGVPMPCSGEEVASYLLEMLADGTAEAVLRESAAAIQKVYIVRRTYLDPRPIEAALAIAAAQLSPNRVLN
jgi:uncharacterized protein (DUF2236 family)